MDLVAPQRGVAVRLNPHAGHGVVEDLVVSMKPRPVDEHAG